MNITKSDTPQTSAKMKIFFICIEILLLIATAFSVLGMMAGSVKISNTLLPSNMFNYEGWLCYVFGTVSVAGFIGGIFMAIRGLFATKVESYEISSKGIRETSDGCMAQLMSVFITPPLMAFITYAFSYYLFWMILESGAYLLPYIIGILLIFGAVIYLIKIWKYKKIPLNGQLVISFSILLLYGGIAFFLTNGVSLNDGIQQIETMTNSITTSLNERGESFDDFRKRFTSDVDFQWSRVKFPLGTLDLGGAEKCPYTKDCWVLRIGVEAFKIGHTEENDGEFVWDARFVFQGEDKVIYTDEYSGIWYNKDTFTFERIGGEWYVTAHEVVFPTMLTVDEFKQNVRENNKKYVK
ncbi:hypothetical protein [Parabacteroides sp.]